MKKGVSVKMEWSESEGRVKWQSKESGVRVNKECDDIERRVAWKSKENGVNVKEGGVRVIEEEWSK